MATAIAIAIRIAIAIAIEIVIAMVILIAIAIPIVIAIAIAIASVVAIAMGRHDDDDGDLYDFSLFPHYLVECKRGAMSPLSKDTNGTLPTMWCANTILNSFGFSLQMVLPPKRTHGRINTA